MASGLYSRGMWAMTFFVVALYSFFFISSLRSPDERAEARQDRSERIELMKEREEAAREGLSRRPALATAVSLSFLAVLFWGLVLDGVLAYRRWAKRPWPVEPLPSAEVAWSARDVFFAFAFLLFFEAFLYFGQGLVWLAFGLEGGTPDALLILNSLIRDLAVAGFVWVLVRRRYGQGARELGLRFQKAWAHARAGILGYIAAVPPLLLVFLALSAVMRLFALEPEPQNVVEIYLKDSNQPFLLALTFFVAFLGPVMEEVFFRGFAYGGLRRRFGVFAGACLSSAAFAALHMHWLAFFPIFALGLFLALLYEVSGSLVPAITAHALHNTLMVVMMLVFKGLAGP